MIGTALAIFSLATSAAATAGSARANKKAEQELARRKQEMDLEYKYDYNQDVLNTPQAKSVLSRLSSEYITRSKQVAQGNAISGASDERAVASAEKMQKPFTDVISNLAGYGTQRQDAIRRGYLYQKEHLNDLTYQNMEAKGANWQNLASNAAGAAGAFSMADASGAFEGADAKLGDWWRGSKMGLKNLANQSWTGSYGGATKLAGSNFK